MASLRHGCYLSRFSINISGCGKEIRKQKNLKFMMVTHSFNIYFSLIGTVTFFSFLRVPRMEDPIASLHPILNVCNIDCNRSQKSKQVHLQSSLKKCYQHKEIKWYRRGRNFVKNRMFLYRRFLFPRRHSTLWNRNRKLLIGILKESMVGLSFASQKGFSPPFSENPIPIQKNWKSQGKKVLDNTLDTHQWPCPHPNPKRTVSFCLWNCSNLTFFLPILVY